MEADSIPLLGSWQFRAGFVALYFIFAIFLYLTFFQLLRVDMGPDKYFVSNYMKTYAYSYEDIARIKESNYGVFKLITIHLKAKGSLGKRITFIPSYKNYEFFVNAHPEVFMHLL